MSSPSKPNPAPAALPLNRSNPFNKAPENPDGRRAMCKDCEREVRIEKKAREGEYGKRFFKF
jgi:hypothetical protein